MKTNYLLFLAVILMTACSSPKYTYNFDHYDYSSGKARKVEEVKIAEAQPITQAPAESPVLTASAGEVPVILDQRTTETASIVKNESTSKSYKEMSKSERKAFRQEVKKEFKKYVQAVKKGEINASVGQNGTLDPDLKLAIIFGAVGLVLALFGGISEVFSVLGVIAILVGVYFLIKWLIRQ